MSFDNQASYGGKDLKISQQLTDVPGGARTYANALDAACIQDFSWNVVTKVIELKGDDGTDAVKTVIDKVEGSFKVGRENFDILAILQGGTASAVSGSSPNRTQSYTQKTTQTGNYFQLEFQGMDMENISDGDLHTILHKCLATEFQNAMSQDNPREITFNFVAIRCDNNSDLYTLTKNETAIDIVSTVDLVAPTITTSSVTDGESARVVSNTSFTFASNKALHPSTINTDTVFIQNKTTGTIVATGAPTLAANGLSFTITASANFAAATAHQIILTKAISSLSQVKLTAHQIYDFTTA